MFTIKDIHEASAAPADVPPRFIAERIEVSDGVVTVHFEGGAHADFHLRWLRHNAGDDLHPLTAERTRCSSELGPEITLEAARVEAGDVLLKWGKDEPFVRYASTFLGAHAYAWNRTSERPPSDLETVTVHGRGYDSWEALLPSALRLVHEHGMVIVRGRLPGAGAAEDNTEPLIDAFARVGLQTRSTHFGRIEDLRTDNVTNANTDQLGYTDSGIELHTDQPFLADPPRYQLLQSIRRADTGGENFFVDAQAAARYLGSLDAPALELLERTTVRFHRQQRSFESIHEGPVLVAGPPFSVRLSYFTLAPHRLPFALTESFYRAHDAFVAIVRNRRHQRRLTLEEGEWVLYDNHRTLHARTGFSGPRWVRGVYFDPLGGEGARELG